MGLINFHLTQNWSQDLLRAVLADIEDGELKDMVEELAPFRKEYQHNVVSIMNEAEMKAEGLWSEATLTERYKSKTLHDYRSDQEI